MHCADEMQKLRFDALKLDGFMETKFNPMSPDRMLLLYKNKYIGILKVGMSLIIGSFDQASDHLRFPGIYADTWLGLNQLSLPQADRDTIYGFLYL